MQTIDSIELKLASEVRATLDQGKIIAVSDGSSTIAYLVSAGNPSTLRPFGLCKGEFDVPEDFNDPSPEIEEMFYKGS